MPWFPILLVVLGVGLLIEGFTDLSFGSVVVLGVGLALGAVWLLRGVVGATVLALVLTAWGLAGIATDLGLLVGDGWRPLLIGVAFLVGWGLGRFQGARREWALFLGAILAAVGVAGISDALPEALDLGVVIALAMVAVGLYLILRSRMPARP